MSRIARRDLKSEFFHIMAQGINKSYIFEHSQDIKYYIKLMYKLIDDYKINIVSYCIMSNHAHILVKVKQLKELGQYMQRLNSTYGYYYNKKYQTVGYVFRDRYKSEPIMDEKHLYYCIKYIYNNPVKAGICKRADEYPYSNYKFYNNKFENENENDSKYTFIDTEETKELEYKQFLNDFITKNSIKLCYLRSDEKLIKQLIYELKDKYKISFRKMSEDLQIGRKLAVNT